MLKNKLDKHLYLIGPRGSGKSHVGSILARSLAVPFHDLDEIVQREEKRNISQIVLKDGWPSFRAMESKTLAGLAMELAPAVIATGGGVVLDESNCYIMRGSGRVIYLAAPLDVLVERLMASPGAEHRPALTDMPLAQEMAQIMRERQHLYKNAATAVVDASLPAQAVAEAILKAIFEDGGL